MPEKRPRLLHCYGTTRISLWQTADAKRRDFIARPGNIY